MSFDLEPPITHGELWCLRCHATTWFVSWDEAHVGPEHAECRECGFKYGDVEERVVDPVTGSVTFKRRPVLDPEVWRAAKTKMQNEFVRELYALDVANGFVPGYGATKLGYSNGPNTANR